MIIIINCLLLLLSAPGEYQAAVLYCDVKCVCVWIQQMMTVLFGAYWSVPSRSRCPGQRWPRPGAGSWGHVWSPWRWRCAASDHETTGNPGRRRLCRISEAGRKNVLNIMVSHFPLWTFTSYLFWSHKLLLSFFFYVRSVMTFTWIQCPSWKQQWQNVMRTRSVSLSFRPLSLPIGPFFNGTFHNLPSDFLTFPHHLGLYAQKHLKAKCSS